MNGRFGAVVVGVVVGWTVDCLPVFQFVEMLKKQLRLKCIRVVVVQLFALLKWHIVVGAVVVVVVKHGHLITKCVFQAVCKSGFS